MYIYVYIYTHKHVFKHKPIVHGLQGLEGQVSIIRMG